MVQIILAVAAQNKWRVFQFDVKSAFLNSFLDEDVYVAQPQGFIIEGQEEKVYKLKKALYELKQAPRAWYSRLDTYLHKNRYHRSDNEPTLYVNVICTGDILIICVYIDDIRYTSSSNDELWELLRAGTDTHRTVPEDRFDWKAHYDASHATRNTSRVKYGCFVRDPVSIWYKTNTQPADLKLVGRF